MSFFREISVLSFEIIILLKIPIYILFKSVNLNALFSLAGLVVGESAFGFAILFFHFITFTLQCLDFSSKFVPGFFELQL